MKLVGPNETVPTEGVKEVKKDVVAAPEADSPPDHAKPGDRIYFWMEFGPRLRCFPGFLQEKLLPFPGEKDDKWAITYFFEAGMPVGNMTTPFSKVPKNCHWTYEEK